jgi:hypothetical protein
LGSGRWRAAAFGCTSRVGPARRAWDRRRQDRETLPCRVPDEAEASQENVSEGARDQPRAWLGLSIQLVGRPSARLATPSPAGGLGVSSPADHEGPCLLQPAKRPQSSTRKPATARSNIVPAKASSAGVGQLTVRTTSVFLPAGTARGQEGSAACQHWRYKATLLGASDAAGCGCNRCPCELHARHAPAMRQTAMRIATASSSVLLNLRTDCRPLSVHATGWFGGLGAGGVSLAPGMTAPSTVDDRASLSCASESKWKLQRVDERSPKIERSACLGRWTPPRMLKGGDGRTQVSSGRRHRARPRESQRCRSRPSRG